MFWSNHFCVSANKGAVRGIAGAYEREAIRPHVLGRFADMLLAVETHPAMLIYLDNQASVGPNSRAGPNRGRGLNENLAREILELHTLGVGGGYTQDDVTNLARILTGWTVGNLAIARTRTRQVLFRGRAARAGRMDRARQALSRSQAWQTGEEVLRALAAHPPRHGTSRASWRAISWPMSRRPRLSRAWRRLSRDRRRPCRPSPRRWCSRTRPGTPSPPKWCRPMISWSL